MSGVAIIYKLLAAAQPIAAANIFSGFVPNGIKPAICITQVSSLPRNTVSMNDRAFVTDRVQVTVYAKSYAQAKTIIAACRTALPVSHKFVGNYECEAILPDTDGPDMYDEQTELHEQSVDFIVKYLR